MKISPTQNVTFNAKIISCRALDAALEQAQLDALSGTKEGLNRASELYNNLCAIEKDKKSKIFYIETHSKKCHPYLRLDEHIKLLGPLGTTKEKVALCIRNGINKLINETYLKDIVQDETKNIDLTKAFLKWL